MLLEPAAPALNAVNNMYVGIKTVRRPNISENGPHLYITLDNGADSCSYHTYITGPTAKPNTNSEIPNMKTSSPQLNSLMISAALPEYALESIDTMRAACSSDGHKSACFMLR